MLELPIRHLLYNPRQEFTLRSAFLPHGPQGQGGMFLPSPFSALALNPTVNFQVGDQTSPLSLSDHEIFAKLNEAFTEHEAAREFRVPKGTSAWKYAQQWAQQAVDRESGTPLPSTSLFTSRLQPILSYAIGVALGRFRGKWRGILNELSADTTQWHRVSFCLFRAG